MSMTPFEVSAVNTDHGSEFMNRNMMSFWAKYPDIELTHSRPMHKNDNAHAEQKNRTHVRELFGRYRLEKEEYVEKMNYIYSIFNLLQNYFMPCKKVQDREYNRNHSARNTNTIHPKHLGNACMRARSSPEKKKIG